MNRIRPGTRVSPSRLGWPLPAERNIASRRLSWVRIAIALALVPVAGRAETAWLRPERFAVTPGTWLQIELLRGPAFGESGAALERSAVLRTGAVLAAQPVTFFPFASSSQALRLMVALPQPGVAVLTAELKPERQTLTREEVEAYFREVHATDRIRNDWSRQPPEATWRELRQVRLKTFVRVGEPPASDHGWSVPAESGLDIVPERDPTALRENDECGVRITRDGHPLIGAVVSYLSLDGNREHVTVTDGEGHASARLDAAVVWLVRVVDIEPAHDAGHDWDTADTAIVLVTK
ncbi:MAG TPA: DUF4198 domain-containing protein [Opitutaceae bacterium]|nr:DUF4198 domain-containing protein [Opitutaceae bacterium]